MRSFVRTGAFWLLVSEALYAVMRVSTRAGAVDLPWAEIGAARFLGGALVAIVSGRARGRALRVGDQKNAWLRSAFGTGGALALFYALGSARIAVGDATTLYATSPLWVALLSGPVLRERVGLPTWISIALGFAGVAVLLGAHFSAADPLAAIVVAGAFSYALALLRLRRMGPHESSEAIALHMSVFAGVTMLLVALPGLRVVRPAAYVPLAISAVSGGLAQVAVGIAYARASASRMAALSYAGVVFTYALEAVTFRRQPTLHQIVGALMVMTAGVVVSLAAPAARRPAAAAASPAAR